MQLTRVDQTLEDCQQHLDEAEAFGTPIETLLTYSLLVIIHAEFEQTVNAIIDQRCDLIDDPSLSELVRGCIGNISRIHSGAMGDILQRFGEEFKQEFREEIVRDIEMEKAESYYNNLITNRHYTAHSVGSSLTFSEVKEYYERGHVILHIFKETLIPEGRE